MAHPEPGQPQNVQPDVPPSVVDAPTGDAGWTRVHPLTPAINLVAIIVAVIAGLIAFGQSVLDSIIRAIREGRPPDMGFFAWMGQNGLLWVAAAALAVLLIIGLLNYLLWRAMAYRVDDEAVYLRETLISRKLRSARLDRVQSIDVYQKILPRIFGLAGLVFDVAGGSDSKIEIAYLTRSQAESLRAEMLTRVRAAKQRTAPEAPGTQAGAPTPADGAVDGQVPTASGTGEGTAITQPDVHARELRTGDTLGARVMRAVHGAAGEVTADAEQTLHEVLAPYRVSPRTDAEGRIVRIPAHIVILSQLFTLGVILLGLLLIAAAGFFIVMTVFFPGRISLTIALSFLPAIFGLLAYARSTFTNANFSASLSEDGLQVARGLLSTSRRTIRLERIQAVRMSQPLLWRLTGWWKVEFNMAGGETGDGDGDNVLLPVGSREQALMMLALALPDPPADGIDAHTLFAAAMYADEAAKITDADPAALAAVEQRFVGQPPSSRWLDPLTYKRNGWTVTGSMLIIRSGCLTRQVTCTPHARVQSMRWHQGPLQRRFDLASINLDSTAGPVAACVLHQLIPVSWQFFFDHAERTRSAREVLDGRTPAAAQQTTPQHEGGTV
ncbi:PH domain-containing protein [Brevibacterium luteolum]|uniref:PH domain-containing protein n=1 Tax=Brevibacterium luteolum TaxID=199591 RepID=UPI003EE9969D